MTTTGPAQTRRSFHITIPSVLSGFFLAVSMQALVLAANRFLMPPGVWLLNWVIRRGNYDVLLAQRQTVSWPVVLTQLTLAIIWLIVSVMIADWIRPSPK